LSTPLLRANLFFVKIDWIKVISLIKKVFQNLDTSTKYVPINFYTGDYLDIETAGILKKLSSVLGLPKNKNHNDQRLTFPMQDLVNSKSCILAGLNLRLQLPVLNLTLRQY
jgi:HKD family nuclease